MTIPRSIAAAILAASTMLLAPGCASGVSGLSPISTLAASEMTVAPGDKLRVSVQDLPAMDGEYTVDDAGTISLPVIKDVRVAGLGYRETERAVEQALVSQQVLLDPTVSIQPLELRPVYVMGEVNRPGEVSYRQGMTVFAAISVAGGYTYRANQAEVAVTRTHDGRTVTGTASADTPIRPGDRIKVHERWF